MKLMLKWESKGHNEYNLGILSKDEKYIFEINEEELKMAIKDGCFGIPGFNYLENRIESDELFAFFKNRIPSQEKYNIKEILNKYGLKNYDDMKLLVATKGRSINDRYWLEEI